MLYGIARESGLFDLDINRVAIQTRLRRQSIDTCAACHGADVQRNMPHVGPF